MFLSLLGPGGGIPGRGAEGRRVGGGSPGPGQGSTGRVGPGRLGGGKGHGGVVRAEGEGGGVWVVDFGLGRSRGGRASTHGAFRNRPGYPTKKVFLSSGGGGPWSGGGRGGGGGGGRQVVWVRVFMARWAGVGVMGLGASWFGWGGVPWSGAEGEGGGVWVVDFGLGRSRG